MNINSLIRNLFIPSVLLAKDFSNEILTEIEREVLRSENESSVQILFSYQTHKSLKDIFKNTSTREIAEREFSSQRVWDTENNNGILFYLLLVEREFEIVADRGITKFVPIEIWNKVADEISQLLKSMPTGEAAIKGIELITKELKDYFPVVAGATNEIPDKPKRVF